jgi:hypothetical protein
MMGHWRLLWPIDALFAVQYHLAPGLHCVYMYAFTQVFICVLSVYACAC